MTTESFIPPVAGAITQPFKPVIHTGIDIGAPDHSTVVATSDGVVTYEGIYGAGGQTIIIGHGFGISGEYESYYMHLSEYLVNKGAKVVQGQPIAKSGGVVGEKGAGNSTGAHLHFEIRHNGIPIDPIKIYGQTFETSSLPPGVKTVENVVGGTTDVFKGAGKALGFLTTKNNWVRIGLGLGGVALLALVVNKMFAPQISQVKNLATKVAVA